MPVGASANHVTNSKAVLSRHRRKAPCQAPDHHHAQIASQALAEVAAARVRGADPTEDVGEEEQQERNERNVVDTADGREILAVGCEASLLLRTAEAPELLV